MGGRLRRHDSQVWPIISAAIEVNRNRPRESSAQCFANFYDHEPAKRATELTELLAVASGSKTQLEWVHRCRGSERMLSFSEILPACWRKRFCTDLVDDRFSNFRELRHFDRVAVDGAFDGHLQTLFGLGVFQKIGGAVVALVVELVELTVFSIDRIAALFTAIHQRAGGRMVFCARGDILRRFRAGIVD